MFNIRKQKLNQITRANLAIHEKINNQPSHYGQKFHTKTENIASLSRDKFKTIEESRKIEKFRSALGPISNFQGLAFPSEQRNSEFLETKHTKLRSLPPKQVFKKSIKKAGCE